MVEIGVRPFQRADVRASSAVLARAFYDDPVMMFMLPDDQARVKVLPRMFATLTRHHFLARDVSEVASRAGTIGAATLWDPPGRRKSSRLEELLMMPTMMRAFRGRAKATQALGRVMEQAHPEEPHWYLMVIQRPVGAGRGLRSGADALPPGSVRRRACAGLPGGEQGRAGPVLQPVRLRVDR